MLALIRVPFHHTCLIVFGAKIPRGSLWPFLCIKCNWDDVMVEVDKLECNCGLRWWSWSVAGYRMVEGVVFATWSPLVQNQGKGFGCGRDRGVG